MDQAELLRYLRDTPEVAPFVGAGMALPAGAPNVRRLAAELARRTEVAEGSLGDVVAAATDRTGLATVQQAVAEIIIDAVVAPTSNLVSLARWPTRTIFTTNYDDAVEQSITRAQLQPEPIFDIRSAATHPPVAEGVVRVVHLHGAASQPETIVLPGPSTHGLLEDDRFLTSLRVLLQRHPTVCLGFSLSSEEHAMVETLIWLSAAASARKHVLVLPQTEFDDRREELTALSASVPQLSVVGFKTDASYAMVAALTRAAISAPDGSGSQAPMAAGDRPAPYVLPRLIAEREGDDLESIEGRTLSAEHGWGDNRFATVDDLLATDALIVGAPGMGKTELAYRLARESEMPALVAPLKALPNLLAEESDYARAVARLLAEGVAGRHGISRPTVGSLDSNPLVVILDGLDEAAAPVRSKVADAIVQARKRWPTLRWVVTTRPCPEIETLGDWSRFRIVLSSQWAREYLTACGVQEGALELLRLDGSDFGQVAGIPLFAALIAGRLTAGKPLPVTALELVIDAHRDAVVREARRQGVDDPQHLASWIQRLAVGLELAGKTTALVDELAEIPGRGDLELHDFRERLIQAVFLADLPETAAFVQRTLQQSLCAWALLEQTDLREAFARVATGIVAGERALRADMRFTIDLLFEAASREQREQLRDLDADSWARTVLARGTLDDAREALDWLWSQADQRQSRWLGFFDGLRSVRTAVREIARRYPGLIDERRDGLAELCRTGAAHQRHNALWLLATDPDGWPGGADSWLARLVTDDDGGVAELAAELAAKTDLPESRGALLTVIDNPGRRDRKRLLLQLLDGAPDEATRLDLARRVVGDQLFGEVLQDAFNGASLEGVLSVAAEPHFFDGSLRWLLLRTTVASISPEHWTKEAIDEFVAVVARHAYDPQPLRSPGVKELVSAHPQQFVDACAEQLGYRPPLTWALLLLEHVPEPLLDEDLGANLSRARAAADAYDREHTEQAERNAKGVPNFQDEEALLLLNEPGVTPDRLFGLRMVDWPLKNLPNEQKDRLAGLIEARWPTSSELTGYQRWDSNENDIIVGNLLAAGAQLSLPLSPTHWFELLDCVEAHEDVRELVGWLLARYSEQIEDAVLAAIPTADAKRLRRFAYSVPSSRTVVFDAMVERLKSVGEDGWIGAASMIADRGGPSRLLRLKGMYLSPNLDVALRHHLARAGDPDSQCVLLRELAATLPRWDAHSHWRWPAPVSDRRVLEAAADVLEATVDRGTSDGVYRFASGLLSTAESEEVVDVLDQLAARSRVKTVWLRQSVTQRLATQAALSALPKGLGSLACALDASAS